MDIFLIFLIITGIIALVLIIVNIVLLNYSYKANKKIDELLEKGKIKDFKDVFLSQKDKNDNLEKQLREAFLKIKNLEDISKKTVQKIGVVRFDPFNELGGKQSFAVAILDDRNTGFIISSIFVSESNRVFVKSVKEGKSEYTLSNEELEAIDKAINGR